MQNNLQPNLGSSPPRRRPSPYDQRPNQGQQNPYQPQRRPLPPNPAPQQPSTHHQPAAAYQSAYDLLQSHRPAGSFYPEANLVTRPTSKSPEIVSPRPQRIQPAMRDNLAQNLDQQTYKTNSEDIRPSQGQQGQQNQYDTSYGGSATQAPRLPPLNLAKRRESVGSATSSQYTLPSGVEEYLNNEYPQQNQQTTAQSARENPYNSYNAPPPPASLPPRNDPYNAYNAPQSQPPPKKEHRNSYSTPQPPQPYASQPLQPPYVQQQGGSRPNSSHGRPQQPQYPPAPPQVDYSNVQTTSTAPNQSLPQQYPQYAVPSHSRVPSGPQDPYNYPQEPPQNPARTPQPQQRPFSQEMNAPIGHQNTSERPYRTSIVEEPRPIGNDFIDMPDVSIPAIENLTLNDPYQPPPRPLDQTPIPPPSNNNMGTIAMASPPSLIPRTEYEWENEIDSQRDLALRTTDANIALTWAEKVYMFVSISLEELRREQENAAGDAGVTVRSSTPTYEHGLRDDCIRIVERFVKGGHPKAIYMRGIWFEYGDFKYPNDRSEAYHAYQAASKLGYARAEYRLGKMYEDVGDMKRAIHHYEKGVSQADSASLYRMGMLRLLGQKGFPANIPEGIKLLHQSAGKADLDAPQGAYVFALLLEGEFNGVVVPETILPHDERAARRMLEKASSLGFSHAQLKLGNAYENGTWGCGYDPALSLHYYTLAAKQGDLEAMMGLSKWYLCGGEGFAASEEKSFIYAERAAKKGLPQAEFGMGYFYEVGIYVAADFAVAETWYKRAAEHGFKDAIRRYESISRKQTLSRKDHENITSNIRSNRLKKGQKAPPIPNLPPPAPPIQEQYPEAPRAQPAYAQDPARTQSPAGRARYPSGPQGHGRTYSGSQPVERPVNSRHSSYASYNAPEFPQENRKSSYSSNAGSHPSIASLANSDEGYDYSPPVRPQTGSRPVSQGSSTGFPPPTAQPNRPGSTVSNQSFGNGPKTFQEMGVKTSHKKDSDCCVM